MLQLEGISAGYDGQTVLRNVSLTIPDNAVVALLGPNGAGKTTLLRVASGLLAPTAGRVLLDGVDITGWPTFRWAAAGICHVPEGRGVFRTLSVRDNLRLHATAAAGYDPFEELEADFPRLAQRLSQIAGTMSGGEQQMLALARAYVPTARTLLLDELSMGLAPTVVDDIFVRLRALAAKGASLLVVEQYVHRALQLADYVYVLNKGRVDFAGESSELADEQILTSYLGETG